jgi:hypothetical protein
VCVCVCVCVFRVCRWRSRAEAARRSGRRWQGPCKKQNYFGEYNMGKEYSNPSSKVYKILWAERCGADWPCKEVRHRRPPAAKVAH